MTLKHDLQKKKTDKLHFIKIKNLYTTKHSVVKETEETNYNWEEIFTNHIPDKGKTTTWMNLKGIMLNKKASLKVLHTV